MSPGLYRLKNIKPGGENELLQVMSLCSCCRLPEVARDRQSSFRRYDALKLAIGRSSLPLMYGQVTDQTGPEQMSFHNPRYSLFIYWPYWYVSH